MNNNSVSSVTMPLNFSSSCLIYLVIFFLVWQKWKCVAFLHNDDTSSHRKVVIHVPLQIKHLTRTVVKVIEKPVVKEFKHDGEIIHHHRHSGHIEHDHSHDIHSPTSQHQHQHRRDKENIVYPMADNPDADVIAEADLPLRQYQRRRTEQARVNSTIISERNIIRGEAPKNRARRVSEYTTASYRHRPNWPRPRLEGAITATANAGGDYRGINDVAGVQPQRQHSIYRRPNNFHIVAGDKAKVPTGFSQNGRDSYVRVLFRQFVEE